MSKPTKKRTVIYSNVKENKRLAEEKNKKKNEQINLNDEVIIGFNSKKINQENIEKEKGKKKTERGIKKEKTSARKKEKALEAKKEKISVTKKELKKNPQKNKKKNSKNNNVIDNDEYNVTNKIEKNQIKRKIKIPIFLKIAVCISILCVGVFAFLKTSLFNIKKIEVHIDNNSVITASEIKELSQITSGQNMFSIKKGRIADLIKTNAYVESVKIKRVIPDKIQISVIERTIKFQLESDNGYIYVDNQGVIVDKSNEKKDCVLVVGYKTKDIVIGDKVNEEDIKGLSDVLLIVQEAENNGIIKDITKIDISNHDDYIIYFDEYGKLAHIGDITSINDKMTRVAKILNVESEYEGEIFVNVDLNNGEYPYFREKV